MYYDLSLSYSGRKIYLKCPKQYQFKYILKDSAVFDTKNTLFGSIIGKLFEWFYEKQVWKSSNPSDLLLSMKAEAIELVYLKNDYFKGSDSSLELRIESDLIKYVPLGVETIKNQGLLTTNSKSELDLTIFYKTKDDLVLKIVGIADFVHYNNASDIWIMDGKAYKQREKYVDADQLMWYATLHYLKYGVAPSRIGFIYWLHPENPISYISYDSDSMRLLLQDTINTCKDILNKKFDARPSGECHRCAYKPKCEEGLWHIAKRRHESGGHLENSIFDFEDVTSSKGD